MVERNDAETGNGRGGYISRRYFLRIAGTAAVSVGVSGYVALDSALIKAATLADGKTVMPVSKGYLLVDTKKCQGCASCMMACSLVNEGAVDLSLSRIQVIQNPFKNWPDDLTIEQCRQCVDPDCVKACPENALTIDVKAGNVRRVTDADKCTGCAQCVDACSYTPARAMLAPDEIARKCDLCAGAPYHWDPKKRKLKGRQACVAMCPVDAIRYTTKVPLQEGDLGYKVNLRGRGWAALGYPTE
jgi:protein NrfC